MNELTLRDYQWDAVRYAVRQLLDGAPSVAVVAPTGAGKSTIITSVLHKMPTLVTAIVAAPQQAIEDGFTPQLDPLTGEEANPQTIFLPPPRLHLSNSFKDYSVRKLGVGTRYISLRAEKDKQALVGDLLDGLDADRTWGLTTQWVSRSSSFFPLRAPSEAVLVGFSGQQNGAQLPRHPARAFQAGLIALRQAPGSLRRHAVPAGQRGRWGELHAGGQHR